jgi:hypothetical protein
MDLTALPFFSMTDMNATMLGIMNGTVFIGTEYDTVTKNDVDHG